MWRFSLEAKAVIDLTAEAACLLFMISSVDLDECHLHDWGMLVFQSSKSHVFVEASESDFPEVGIFCPEQMFHLT